MGAFVGMFLGVYVLLVSFICIMFRISKKQEEAVTRMMKELENKNV